MIVNVKKLLQLLSKQERKKSALVLALILVVALLETAGVASVIPFLAVLGNPALVSDNEFLAMAYEFSGVETVDEFLVVLGAAALAVILLAAVVRTAARYAINRFVEMRRHSISARLLENYLRQPYPFFINRHSGDMAKTIFSETDHLVNCALQPALNLIAYGAVSVAVIGLLFVVDFWLSVVVGVAIGGAYILVYRVVGSLLDRTGKGRAKANKERFLAASEALTGAKEIKLRGCESVYLNRYMNSSHRFSRHVATSVTASEVPKYIIEAIAFGGILALALFLVTTRNGLGEAIPVLGAYAYAGQRLLIAAQNMYGNAALLRFGAAGIDQVHADMFRLERSEELPEKVSARLVPKREIRLRDVSYKYPSALKPSLLGIDMRIEVGSTVGIIGTTGAGKTTAVDILLGLLAPTKGHLLVDGVPVDSSNLRAWQQSLGYVPQHIFLADSSIAENIALGVPSSEIDHEAVERAARMAQLHDFVKGLPDGYATQVGERGVRLSGGQRQRIGIARALYNDPPVLVFDEATSALDTATEEALLQAIEDFRGKKTLIMIAHRLSTTETCDSIFVLDNGRLAANGTYTEVVLRQAN